ncbi:MAG TPA: M28 family peptidase [Candidatus Krumholzibacteria bacterium]|nr:M28 family peptidase [Candidatus Krumholzibacteria bacterium]
MAGLLAAGAAPAAPDFSGERAFALLEAQCDLGPRSPNSPGLEALRVMIEEAARAAGLSAVRLPFTEADPLGGPDLVSCNIVVSAGPAGGERLWIGAHYDTRPVSDQDPDPARRGEPLVGANDGASGVAVLLHLIELFAAEPPAAGVDLLFLDAEDSGRPAASETFCLGSRHLARTWQDFGNPLASGTPRGLVILDMVGDRDLGISMERYSLAWAGEWTRAVFDRAAALGLGAFRAEPGRAVVDDHLPFLQVGIPAVDLIDFDYPAWHTTADRPEACSAASLEQVGRLVTDLVYHP